MMQNAKKVAALSLLSMLFMMFNEENLHNFPAGIFLYDVSETLVPTYMALAGARNSKSRSFSCCFRACIISGRRM